MISMINISKFKTFLKMSFNENQLEDNGNFIGLCTNSRNYKVGEAFVAITGERFNALQFTEEVIAMGCRCIVYTKSLENQKIVDNFSSNEINFIEVSDSILFLQELALGHRLRIKKINPNLKVMAISGSNGKTTCKEMLRHFCNILGEENIVATQKNDNNHLGVPLTLLRIDETTKVAIIELGSNHPGEIEVLFQVTQPDFVFVTNIGETHLEFFHNLDNVFKEEALPLQRTSKDCRGWVNVDDSYLATIADTKYLYRIGEAAGSFKCTNNKLEIEDQIIENFNLIGKHNYHNLGVMLMVANELMPYVHKNLLYERAREFTPGLMRSQWTEFEGKKVFLDAYNANPSSMKLAVKAFHEYMLTSSADPSEVLYIVGDMMELGDNSAEMHYKTGEYLETMPLQNMIFIGQFAKNYQQGFKRNSTTYPNVASFLTHRDDHFKGYKYIFLKASRSLQFEGILAIV